MASARDPVEVGDRSVVGQDRIQRAGQLDSGRQRPWAAQADLERALVPGEYLLDRVQVGGHHAARGAHVTARPLRDAPAARRRLHRHVDQQRRGPAGQIGTGATAGKFGQVGKVRQLAGHDPGRLRRVRSRHGTDARGAPGQPRERPRPARVTERVILHVAELRPSSRQPRDSAKRVLKVEGVSLNKTLAVTSQQE